MIEVLRKELRELRIVIWTMLALIVAGYWFVPFVRIDELAIHDLCPNDCGPVKTYSIWWGQFDLLLIALMVYMLFVRERETGAIEFVKALPVASSKLFLIKLFAALLVYFIYELVPVLINIGLLQFNRRFLSSGFEDLFIVEYTLLSLLFSVIVISHAVLFSYFRITGFLIYFLFLLVTAVIAGVSPDYGWLSVWSIVQVVETSTGIEPGYKAIYLQSTGAVVALLLGYFLWSGAGVVKTKAIIGNRNRQWLWPLVSTGVVFVCAASFVSMKNFTNILNPKEDLGSAIILRTKSDHYIFNYKSENEGEIESLLQHADRDFETLSDMLGAEIPGARIFVDGTRRLSSAGAAGVAAGRRISVDIDGSGKRLRRVLSHETVHIYQYTESAGKGQSFPETKFFAEGMAEYYSFQVTRDLESKRRNIQPGIVLAQRYGIKLEDVMNSKEFEGKFGAYPLYSLGHIWTEALVASCGEQVTTQILRAIARQRSVRRLYGEHWWRGMLGNLDCDYDGAKQLWQKRISKAVDDSDLEYFPLLIRDNVEFKRESVYVDFVVEETKPAKKPVDYFMSVKFSTVPFAQDTVVKGRRLMQSQPDGKERIRFKFSTAHGSTVQYRVGYIVKDLGVPYSQPLRQISR